MVKLMHTIHHAMFWPCGGLLPANRYASRKKAPAGAKHCVMDCVHMLAGRRPKGQNIA